jgi:hypothetical protein
MDHPVIGGHIQGPGPPGWELDTRLMTMLCLKKNIVKSTDVKIRCNTAESSNEGYGSKTAVLLLMMMMITNNAIKFIVICTLPTLGHMVKESLCHEVM